MSGQTGIIYYGLVSDYTGDITKGCGLTASELDGNFYFLRGKEVSALTWDTDHFVITKYDGTTVESDAVAAYINDTITELLSGLTEAIDSVECMVSGLTNSIDGCYDDLDTLEERVSVLESGVTAVQNEAHQENEQLLETLTNAIQANYTELEESLRRDFSTEISSVTSNITNTIATTNETTIRSLTLAIESSKTEVIETISNTNEPIFENFENKISSITETLNTLTNAVGNNTRKKTGDENRITELEDKLGNINSTVSAIQETLDNTINENSKEITEIKEKTSKHIETLYDDINTKLDSSNTDLQDKIDNINILCDTVFQITGDDVE